MRTLLIIATFLLAAFQAPSVGLADELIKGCLAIKGHEKEFSKTTVEWRGDPGGTTIIVYALINVEDKATVCGLHMNQGDVPAKRLSTLLANSSVSSGRETMVKGLSYFKNACGPEGCKLCAPCMMTSFDWTSSYGRVKPKFDAQW